VLTVWIAALGHCGCNGIGSTSSERRAEGINDQKIEVTTPFSNERPVALASGLFATPISLDGDPQERKITSLTVTANISATGEGSGTLELNQRKLLFTDFGDAEAVGADQSDRISVHVMRKQTDDPKGQNHELYQLALPEKLACKLYLVLAKSTSDESRLVIANGDEAKNVITLLPVSAESRLPVNKLDPPQQIDLTSDVVLTGNGLRSFRIQGDLGGEGRFYLDPNHHTYSIFGEVAWTTAMGWEPGKVAIKKQEAEDPSGKGRILYEIVTTSPRQTRYLLVISPSENEHRLVVRQGDAILFALPMRNSK
jgi:hypothetical protein